MPYHSGSCQRHNRGCALYESDCICGAEPELMLATCEGCGNKFQAQELEVVPCIDADLHWCAACRQHCATCHHIKGTHYKFGSGDACDGDHGEIGECGCAKFVAPPAVLAAAKAIPAGIWMSDRFKQQLRSAR
jgi:hypothetical protein